MGYGWLNIGSICTGMIALLFPVISVFTNKKAWLKAGNIIVQLGYVSALFSLLFQIMYQNHLVEINDIGAVMDTIGPLVLVATTFIIAVCVVNSLCFIASEHFKAR